MINGSTKVAGVMGWPVSHSLSPLLQGYWLEHYGINGTYIPLPVAPNDVETALRALPKLGFAGCNVTLPHKEAAFAAMDVCDESATRTGAVNTVVVKEDGALWGTNSDVAGFVANLTEKAPHASIEKAVVLGAGGVARATICGLIEQGCQTLYLINRTASRAEQLAEQYGAVVRVVPWSERHDGLAEATLLVNATSLGMVGQPPLDINLDALPVSAVVVDTIYTPLKTPLLSAAGARGNTIVTGLGMLMHQAVTGFAAWFGHMPEVTPALEKLLINQLIKQE